MTPGEFQAVALEDVIPAANPSWHFLLEIKSDSAGGKGETREGFGERGSSFSKERERERKKGSAQSECAWEEPQCDSHESS